MKTTVFTRTIPLVFISAVVCFGQTSSTPASALSKFAGTWTENEAKAKLGSTVPLRFRKTADGGLEELRGPDAAPLVEPVHFDGKPYDIDGGIASIVWKQPGPNQFERTSFTKGQLVATRHITISNGGKTLTQVTEQKRTDGTSGSSTTVYARSSGTGSELDGVWQLKSVHQTPPPQVTISVVGTNSLKWMNRIGVAWTAAIDNKPVAVTGGTIISGSMISIKQIDDRTIATTASRNGTVTFNATWKLSSDGKVLTVTTTQAGPNAGKEPSVSVYEKQ